MHRVWDLDIAERLTAPIDPEREDDRIAVEAVTGGSTTVESTGEPFPTDTPFIYDGSVYEVTTTEVEQTPATTFSFTLDPIVEDESVDDDETIRYEDLPDVDTEAFNDHGWDQPDPFVGMGSSVRYRDEWIDDSVLVPQPENPVIVWPETRGRFIPERSRDTPIRILEYESHVVAESAGDYGRAAREQAEFELDDLTDAEREIVSEAVEEAVYGVEEGESVPNAMYRLADRYEERDPLTRPDDEPVWDESTNGDYIVRYRGDVYRSRINIKESVTN